MVQSWLLAPTILASNHAFSSWCELKDIHPDVNVEEFQCPPPTNPHEHPLAKLPNEIQELILKQLPRHTRFKYCLLNHAAFYAAQSRTAIIWQGRRGLYRQVFNRDHNTYLLPTILYFPIKNLPEELNSLSTVIWRGGDPGDGPSFTTFKYALIDLLKVSSKVRYLELVRVHELTQDLIRVGRLKDCPSLRRVTIVRCIQFMIDNIGLESNYPNAIIGLNGKTDLHLKLEILPYDARSWQGRAFNSVGKFPYIARLQRYLPHLIRDHPELIREDTAFRREFLDMEGNGRKHVPAEIVLKLLDLGWKGPVLWRRDNNRRKDPFIDIIKDLYEMKEIHPGHHLTNLYECDTCEKVLYGACYSKGNISRSLRGESVTCMACMRVKLLDNNNPLYQGPLIECRFKIHNCFAAAMESKLSALPLRGQQAMAGDLPHDEYFYPNPRPARVRVMTDDDHDGHDPENEFSGYEVDFSSLQSNSDNNDNSSDNSKNQEDKDDPRLWRRYTYRQCPSLRETVQVMCFRDEADPHVDLDSELRGYTAVTKDLPFMADEKKIIKCEFSRGFAFRVEVLNKPADFEARLKAEEAAAAAEEAKRKAEEAEEEAKRNA